MNSMMKQYGGKKGKSVFYATMNKKGKKWHKEGGMYDNKSVELAKAMKK